MSGLGVKSPMMSATPARKARQERAEDVAVQIVTNGILTSTTSNRQDARWRNLEMKLKFY